MCTQSKVTGAGTFTAAINSITFPVHNIVFLCPDCLFAANFPTEIHNGSTCRSFCDSSKGLKFLVIFFNFWPDSRSTTDCWSAYSRSGAHPSLIHANACNHHITGSCVIYKHKEVSLVSSILVFHYNFSLSLCVTGNRSEYCWHARQTDCSLKLCVCVWVCVSDGGFKCCSNRWCSIFCWLLYVAIRIMLLLF